MGNNSESKIDKDSFITPVKEDKDDDDDSQSDKMFEKLD